MNLLKLQEWCRWYWRNTKYPCAVDRRFAIGFYQIFQGIDWKKSDSAWESNMAAVIHFLTVGEMLELDIESYVQNNFMKLEHEKKLLYKQVLRELSFAQSMVIYGTNKKGIKRNSRYNPDKLARSLGFVIEELISVIPINKRKQAIETAQQIMTGVL